MKEKGEEVAREHIDRDFKSWSFLLLTKCV